MIKTSDRIQGSLKSHGYTVQDACRRDVDEEVCDDITK